MGRRTEQTFLQRGNADGQQAHEKILSVTNYQKNANQNHNDQNHNQNHLTPVIMAINKKKINNNVGEDVENRKPSDIVEGNENWCSHPGKQYRGFSKN